MKSSKQSPKSFEKNSKRLFSHIISHGKEMPLADVAIYLQKYSGDKEYDSAKALEFLKSYRKKFVVKTVEGEQFVEVKSSLKLCKRFMFPSTKGHCDQYPCDKLHVCRGFLEESCSYGQKCKKPHSFDSCVTKRLLIQHNLKSLSPSELKKLFQNALKELKIRYAASISDPRVCVHYRKGVTCKEGDRCKFLHVCEKYIKGSCKSEDECGLSHNVKTRHVRRVLATHNLGDLRNEEKILAILRSNMEPEPSNKKCLQKFQTSLNMKLFSHLIAHGEKCRLPIADVEKFLQEFGRDKDYDATKTLKFINSNCEKFAVQTIKGEQFVEAKTSLELCDGFMFPSTKKKCTSKSCGKLHVCRLFLEEKEKCRFGERCRRPHGFDNIKAQTLLVQHKLDTLSTDVLKTLFQKVLKEQKVEYAKSHFGLSGSDNKTTASSPKAKTMDDEQ